MHAYVWRSHPRIEGILPVVLQKVTDCFSLVLALHTDARFAASALHGVLLSHTRIGRYYLTDVGIHGI